MGDPIPTSRGRSTTSMCKTKDGSIDEKTCKNPAELYKSSDLDLSMIKKKYAEKCHLPKKRFSYIYTQSEKLALNSRDETDLNLLDSSNQSSSTLKNAENSTKPEKQPSSLHSKRKHQPPKKRYSYLYSQSDAPSTTQSDACLKSTSSNEFAHGLPLGDLSLVDSSFKTKELYDSKYVDQSVTNYIGTYQIPEAQQNYLYSQSNAASSDNLNFDTEYAQVLASRSFSHVVPANSLEEMYDMNPIKQFAGIKIYAENLQRPGNQDIYLYSQSKDGSSFPATSYTVLSSNFISRPSHGLSSGDLTLIESDRNIEGFNDTCALDLSTGRKKNDENQLSGNSLNSTYCLKEAHPSSTKTYGALDSSGNICTVKSSANESEMIYLKDLTEAEREERKKELSKRRSEKYRQNCQEKMKQLDEEYHNLQEKNKTLHAKFDNLKQQWDKLFTISPCFAGKCESFKPLNEIMKSFQESGHVVAEVESEDEDTQQTTKCKCKGQMKCETNKCSCYKKLISCTPRCHKNYTCRNH